MIAADRVVDLAYQRLAGDSTLSALVGARISREPAASSAAGLSRFPYVTLGLQASTPLTTLDGTRVWEDAVLRVSLWSSLATGQGWSMIRQMADRVDTLLQDYRGATDGVTVIKYRLIGGPDDLVEQEVDATYLHRVLLYRSEAHV